MDAFGSPLSLAAMLCAFCLQLDGEAHHRAVAETRSQQLELELRRVKDEVASQVGMLPKWCVMQVRVETPEVQHIYRLGAHCRGAIPAGPTPPHRAATAGAPT